MVEALEWSLNQLVRRHEILRTVFPAVDRRPTQRVLPSMPVSLDPVDIGGTEDPMAAVFTIAHEEVERPYDHVAGPLHRLRLLRLGAGDYVLLVALHHMLADGSSADILIRELNVLYPRYLADDLTPLPPLQLQYRDFAIWQREVDAELTDLFGHFAQTIPMQRFLASQESGLVQATQDPARRISDYDFEFCNA
jgi:NRPS condensation-like uncharacterized protein